MRFAVLLLVSLASAGSALGDTVDLLKRTLGGLDRALDFMDREHRDTNLDGVMGIRMTADQLQVLMERVGEELQRCPTSWPLLKALVTLQRKGDLVAEKSIPSVAKTQPLYYAQLGLLLAKGRWRQNYPTRNLSLQAEHKKHPKKFDEAASDVCLSEMLGTSLSKDVPPCTISNDCWTMLTGQGHTEYYLTHEVLYLETGEMAGCSQQMETRAAKSKSGKTVSKMMNYFCSNIFREAKDFEKKGFTEKWKDLLMEQIALCGLMGYRDFLQPTWLDFILSQQDESGCYAVPTYEESLLYRRRKREDRRMKGGCSAHMTSVAISAMGVSIRFLVDEYLASKPPCTM